MKYLVLGIMIVIGFICLYQVKYKVERCIHTNTALVSAIKKTDKEIRLLKADWAYLNRPTRLAPLAEKLLGLGPIASTQIQEMS